MQMELMRMNDDEVSDSERKAMIQKYIQHFNYCFPVTEREIEYFEPPKLLGDIFESIIGAIFVDGGYDKVIEVLQHLFAPLLIMNV